MLPAEGSKKRNAVSFCLFEFLKMTEEEIIVDLSGYLHRCRCCLEDCKGDTFVAVTSYVNERYFDFTSNSVSKILTF